MRKTWKSPTRIYNSPSLIRTINAHYSCRSVRLRFRVFANVNVTPETHCNTRVPYLSLNAYATSLQANYVSSISPRIIAFPYEYVKIYNFRYSRAESPYREPVARFVTNLDSHRGDSHARDALSDRRGKRRRYVSTLLPSVARLSFPPKGASDRILELQLREDRRQIFAPFREGVTRDDETAGCNAGIYGGMTAPNERVRTYVTGSKDPGCGFLTEAKKGSRRTTRLRRSRFRVTTCAEWRGVGRSVGRSVGCFSPLSKNICRARMHAQTAY